MRNAIAKLELWVTLVKLKNAFKVLVVPEFDAAMYAGEFLESLGSIWEKATLEEKDRLLTRMLDVVYIDLVSNRSIVGLLPKPAFYCLFESISQKPDSNVVMFNPAQSVEPMLADQKENAPIISGREIVGLVETGENRTPRPAEVRPESTTGLVDFLLLSN